MQSDVAKREHGSGTRIRRRNSLLAGSAGNESGGGDIDVTAAIPE